MTTPRPRSFADATLDAALRDLASAVDWPAPTRVAGEPDLASRLASRLREAAPPGDERPATPPPPSVVRTRPTWRRPARRAVLLAIAAVLALAAIAGAVGLGLPGIRIQLGGGPVSPPPSVPSATPQGSGAPSPTGASPAVPSAPGSGMGLGTLTPLDQLDAVAGRHIALPTHPGIGPPDAAWVDRRRADQVALVWADRPGLPATSEPGVGLLLMSFDGTLTDGYYTKVVDSGTTVTPVQVGGDDGFWIDGDPHFFFYETAAGEGVVDERRWVDQALIWSDGRITQRLETALAQADAVRIAESVR